MTFEVGDQVVRRYGWDAAKLGVITGRVHEGYDSWEVRADNGCTYRDNGKDIQLADAAPQPAVAGAESQE